MRTKNKVLMEMALESLRGKWGIAVGAAAIMIILSSFSSALGGLGSLVSLIITGPITLGFAIFTLAISRNQEAKVSQVFDGFNYFWKSVGTYLLMALFIILWALLLIIPGIIAALSYSMAFFILADDRNIGPMEAIDKSKKMMYGYKWKFFLLGLRFIGWGLLCILTIGIGFLWLLPYIQVSFAKFYEDIKNNPITKEAEPVIPEQSTEKSAEQPNATNI